MTQGNNVVAFRPRLPAPENLQQDFDLTFAQWGVLVDSTFPSAKTVEGVLLAVNYCRARKLDIFKRPVSIVPMWSAKLRREVETVWPGIGEAQITASRTQAWAGMDEAVFGPDITEQFRGSRRDEGGHNTAVTEEVTYPEWCKFTVYRMVQGVRCPFTVRVFWKETYSRMGSRNSKLPTDVWIRRPKSQLEKCAKAAALRAAFPEEVSYVAEEMEGRTLDEVTLNDSVKENVGFNPDTGEIIQGEFIPPEQIDLSKVTDYAKAKVSELVTRAMASNQWEAAYSWVSSNPRFSDYDRRYAEVELRRAENEVNPASA